MAQALRARASRPGPLLDDAWVRPHWLERAAGRSDAAPANTAHRRWTVVGNLDSTQQARVDPRGLVGLVDRPWSIDWWIGAEDRWYVPAREAAVRQGLLGAAPVVETRLRVPSGDAVQRVFAARDAAGREALVIEIENATKVPFAVAIALRPYGLERVGGVGEVAVDGLELRADGRLAALLPVAPRHAAAATGATGDVAAVVFAGGASPGATAGAACPQGLATLAVLHPLAHTATMRVVVPLGEEPPDTATLPDVASVVSGWKVHARAGARVDVPDRRLQAALDSSLRHLLLQAAEPSAARALDRYGFHHLAAAAILDAARHTTTDAPGAALAALTEHWSASRDGDVAGEASSAVAALVAALARPRRGGPWHRRVLRRPPSGSDAGLAAGDEREGIERLALAAELLAAAGEDRAALDVRSTSAALAAAAGPADERADGEVPAVAQAGVRADDGALLPAVTMRLARTEIEVGATGSALVRLSWALGVASGTWTWPATIPPTDPAGGGGDGGGGDGHDVAANAELLLLVRALLVADRADGLALSPVVPDAWLGQGWELHDAPTSHGRLSFAVRWHGERPALLWDLERPDESVAVPLTAPALDRAWSTTDARGEALLAPVAIPQRAPRRGLSIPVSIEPAPRNRS